MKRLLAVVLLGVGCGTSFSYQKSTPTSDVEHALLAETAWAAGAMGVKVHGEITDSISVAQCAGLQPNQYPAGWYQAGVAWYYRPQVTRLISIDPEPYKETAKNVAVHEVCHATYGHHDLAHWECMNKWATPTYPRP